jgi:DNA-directed RNA polymerase specialized sigma24 family protein
MMTEIDEAARYRAALDALPDLQRRAFRLHCVLDWKIGDIAAALRVPARDVEDHLAAAIVAIGRALDAPSGSAG